MEHTAASLQINFSNDYARFRMINGNRQLNDGKIKKILKEIAGGNDMRRYYPIQVRENGDRLDILDGQHRFYIAKKLRSPVYYILVQEEKSMPDIAKINSNVEKWNNSDFINCYVQHGNDNYKILEGFIDTYGVAVGTALKLLAYGYASQHGFNDSLKDKFQQGLFEVKFLKYATELMEDCKRFSGFALWKDRNFIAAVDKIKKDALIDIDDVIVDFKKRPEQLTRQIDYKKYIYNLEQIVNIGKHKRVLIAA